MQKIYERCCGVDVHKRTIVACFRKGNQQEMRQFGATTGVLRELAKWLLEGGCEKVAMESTGAYWKPVYNVLEVLGVEAIVVNAQHMKAVPGRKTDTKDAQWIAELLQHGLLRASFVPDKEQRELREVSRYRKGLIEERSREVNRLEKTLEGANIKLSSFVSNIVGKSSRRLIDSAISGTVSQDNILDMLHGHMHAKKDELLKAMEGVMTVVQKKLIQAILDHIDDMTRRISDMDDILTDEMRKYDDAIAALDEIPGIGRQSAQTILAEIGLDMRRFPTASHLASWAGLSPGNNESAGKRKSGRTCKGNQTLKVTLIQSAKAAVRHKDCFFRAQYDRLAVRRGRNRATVAVAHSMLRAIFHMLKNNQPYQDLGSDYYTKFNTEKKINAYLKKLSDLGWQPPAAATA